MHRFSLILLAFVTCACQKTDAVAPSAPVIKTADPTAAAPVCQGTGCSPGDPLAPLPAPATTAAALDISGSKYGAGITLTTNTSMSEILANPQAWAGKRVRVEGEVEDVCQMRGCWFSLQGDQPGKSLKFKVTDGEMEFPKDSAGKHAVAEGTVRLIPLSLEQTKKAKQHEADEQGKPFDPNSVTAPETLVRLDGIGAVLSEKK
jgi:hypothetical protein